MITSGILTLFGLVALVLAFAIVSSRRGSATALVSLCWVPLVALILGFAARQGLGYAFFGLLIAIVVLSVVLGLMGAVLTIRAHRTGSGPIRALALGTVVAATPFVLVLGAWVILSMRGH